MNTFQITVLSIAIVLLTLILTSVGVIMAKNKTNLIFPPSALSCPNYWQLNSDGTCAIPVTTPAPNDTGSFSKELLDYYNPVNVGNWDKKNYNGKPIPGLDASGFKIDFSDNGWGSNSYSATCAKRDWAKKNNIFWDGVSNYNGCK